ncbi:2822_t:CDS:2, partial [Ambispora leptoticha]
DGLNAIHEAKLVHKDFYPVNIVNQNMYSSYITDFGLYRPVSKDANSKELFGVFPYISPKNIPHDEELTIRIYYSLRPEIRCEVPQLLLNLLHKQNLKTDQLLKD